MLPPIVYAIQTQIGASLTAHTLMIVIAAYAIATLLILPRATSIWLLPIAAIVTIEACLAPAGQRLGLVTILTAGQRCILIRAVVAVGRELSEILCLERFFTHLLCLWRML